MAAKKKFAYKVSIPAPAQKQADQKMSALMTMASRLTAGQLLAFESVVKSDPTKIDLALSFIGYKK